MRYAAYSSKWLVILSLGLAATVLARPWSDVPPIMFVVFVLYIGFGLGSVAALLATSGFLVGSFWARALEANSARQRRWTRTKKYLYACLVLIVLMGVYGAVVFGFLFGETFFPSRRGILVRYRDDEFWFLVSMAFWVWGCVAGPRYALRVVREARAT
jgi:hypothetical protein